jgi:hypothetical protein
LSPKRRASLIWIAFSFDKADILNKSISEKVMGWQRLGGLPESHTWALLETAKKVLKGLMADGKDKEAEVQTDVERKESPRSSSSEEGNRGSPEGKRESGNDSDSSGVLIGVDECPTPPKESDTPITEESSGEPEISPPEVKSADSTS